MMIANHKITMNFYSSEILSTWHSAKCRISVEQNVPGSCVLLTCEFLGLKTNV